MTNKQHSTIINTSVITDQYDVFWDAESIKRKALKAKPVLIITHTGLKEEERELINKIVIACKLSDQEYNLLSLDVEERFAWHLLRDELKVSTLISFGVDLAQLGVTVQLMAHQTNRFDGCNWIPTATPAQMIAQPEIKTHLWNYGLKPVFIDKIYKESL